MAAKKKKPYELENLISIYLGRETIMKYIKN